MIGRWETPEDADPSGWAADRRLESRHLMQGQRAMQRVFDVAPCRGLVRPALAGLIATAALVVFCGDLSAQSYRLAGTEFDARRTVTEPERIPYSVVVTEFLHHGEINAEGTNLVVAARNRDLVPHRILQLGPGDFCRVAFQTIPGQRYYDVFYGGEPPKTASPTWTNQDGLLLETRQYRDCDFSSLDSVRRAFEASTPIGSDYVDGVSHARNPFSLQPAPFLSRYTGRLNIPATGTFGFWTSSHDCSFLLIDGKLVVSAPGRHGPERQARPDQRKDVRLEAGPHTFEYYHAAATRAAMMAVAWQVDPVGKGPAPRQIPPGIFQTSMIGRLPAGRVELRTTRLVPDFRATLAGDVPLPDDNLVIVGVRFEDDSPEALVSGAKVEWDFGDGQSGDQRNVDHVYLQPGIYAVKLTIRRGGSSVETTNRIEVDRPPVTNRDRPRLHTLADYLPTLESYNPRALDAVSLRQLVLAFEARALELEQDDKPESLAAAEQYFGRAVAAGKVAFSNPSAARGPQPLLRLAELIGPMARDRLGDSRSAAEIWEGAAQRINAPAMKARCAIQAADVAVNDLLDAVEAKRLLDVATAALGSTARGADAGELQRVWGDYYAATGNGQAAREAYDRAEQAAGATGSYAQRTAWRGAHSRSTEEYIRQGAYDRAAAEIRQWQQRFPTEKVDGYLTLLYAEYFAGRKMWGQAIGQAEQLQAVSPDSPYADRLLLVAAECEQQRGRIDRALATLEGLLEDYPGSPLVPEVKQRVARLEAEQKK